MARQTRGTVNYVELIGWVGDEPEQRLLASGIAICMFRVATKHPGPRDAAGERTYETDWTGIEAWDRLAVRCLRSLHKGSRVRVVGSLQTQSWDDKETGQRRYKTIVRADEVMFLDTKPSIGTSAATEAEVEADADEEIEQTEDIAF